MSSLLKLTVLRVTKYKSFMRNIRTPLHDHVRDNLGFSDTQTVLRFSVFQFVISLFFYMFI
jgi:phospho-N-acetylmuramoyl-pentapeptide-transferase